MARAVKRETDWVDEYRKNYVEPTDEQLARFSAVLAEADAIRKRLKIAPLTTGELVRSMRDEQESAN